jgi:hypothetical protein
MEDMELDVADADLVAQARRIKARAEELLRDHRELEAQARARRTADRLSRMTPEARLRWRGLLADLHQHTRDEERKERQAKMRGQGDLLISASEGDKPC